MNTLQCSAYIGKTLVIRGVPHLCVAAEKECLMFLQFTEEGAPIQYVVAHHPMLYKGEMVWSNGNYFPLLNYAGSATPMADAIRDSGFAMGSDTIYTAMADDELGARCVGVFTEDTSARTALETLIARDAEACKCARAYGYARLTLADYEQIYNEEGLENAYWIEDKRLNRMG